MEQPAVRIRFLEPTIKTEREGWVWTNAVIPAIGLLPGPAAEPDRCKPFLVKRHEIILTCKRN